LPFDLLAIFDSKNDLPAEIIYGTEKIEHVVFTKTA